MLDFIKSLFATRTADLEAKLAPVNGGGGYGEVEYKAWSNGERAYEIELRQMDGPTADVRVNGTSVRSLALASGRFDTTFSTRNGDPVPEMVEGDRVEIFQNGSCVLEGVAVRD